MRFPGLFAAIQFSLGIVVAGISGQYISPVVWFGAFPVSAGAWLLARRIEVGTSLNTAPLLRLLAAGIALAATGGLTLFSWSSPDPGGVERWIGGDSTFPIAIQGRIRTISPAGEDGLEARVDVSRARSGSAWRRMRGRVLYRTFGDRNAGNAAAWTDLHPGDVVRVSGALEALPLLRNPFDFDTAGYLRREGVSALVRPPETGGGDHPLNLVLHRHGGLAYLLEGLRLSIRDSVMRIQRSESARQIMPALLVGDRSLIRPESRDAFRQSGLAHLLAISGLHVGIVGMTLFWLTGLVAVRFRAPYRTALRARCAFTMCLLVLYALVSGGSPSVGRAVVMAGVLLLGKAVDRRAAGWNAIGVASIVVLALRPEDLFSVGFQLSFSAVGGIFLLVRLQALSRAGRHDSIASRVGATLAMSAAVTCGTLPVMLFHFGSAAIGGLAANVVAIPLTAILLVSGLLAFVTAWIPIAGPSLAGSTDLLASILFAVADFTADTAGGIRLESATGRIVLVAFLPAFLLYLGTVRKRSGVLGRLLLYLFIVIAAPEHRSSTLKAAFLDVGQGDAAVLVSPAGRVLVVDTGAGKTAARALADHLLGLGIRRIDILAISHFHLDHAGGISLLTSLLPVSRAVVSKGLRAEWEALETSRRAHRALVREVVRGDTLRLDASVNIRVLAPDEAKASHDAENDRSIVLQIRYGDTSFLLTGDAERSTETGLIASFGPAVRSNVIKVAHHGSKTSSSRSFVLRAASSGSYAIVSVGTGNRFDHPSPEIIHRWRLADSIVLTTAENGALLFESDGSRIELVDWRKARRSNPPPHDRRSRSESDQ